MTTAAIDDRTAPAAPLAVLPTLLTYQQITARTGISADVIRRAARSGELTPYGPPNGRAVRYAEPEIASWLTQPRKRFTQTVYDRPAGLPGGRIHW